MHRHRLLGIHSIGQPRRGIGLTLFASNDISHLVNSLAVLRLVCGEPDVWYAQPVGIPDLLAESAAMPRARSAEAMRLDAVRRSSLHTATSTAAGEILVALAPTVCNRYETKRDNPMDRPTPGYFLLPWVARLS